ncbi:unnamed protein product [Closterium sp. NIES-54]
MLPASLQKNGVAECRIGFVMEVARTSMIHAAAPHFLWPFAVRYTAHQLNLWPRVSLPETSPTPRWTGKVGDASVFWDLAPSGVSQVDPLPLDEPFKVTVDSGAARGAASGGAEPASAEPEGAEPARAEPGGAEAEGAEHGGAESEGVKSLGAEPEGAEPGVTESEGGEPRGAESEGAESGGAEPRGTASAGGPVSALPRLSGAARAGGPAAGGTGAGGAGGTVKRSRVQIVICTVDARLILEGLHALSPGGLWAHSDPLLNKPFYPNGADDGVAADKQNNGDDDVLEYILKSFILLSRPSRLGGVTGSLVLGSYGRTDPHLNKPFYLDGLVVGILTGTSRGGAGVTARAEGPRGAGAAGPGGARTKDTGAAGAGGVGGTGDGDPGAGGTGAGDPAAGGTGAESPGAGGAGAGDPGAGGAGAGGTGAGDPGAGGSGAGGARAGGVGAGGTVQRRPFFVPLPPSSLPPPAPPDSPLPAPSPYAEQTDSLTERRELESQTALPVCAVRTGRRVPCPRPPPVPGTLIMTLRPSSIPLRVPLPSPPVSSLADGPDPESDLVRAASPSVTCLLATVVTDPWFESAAACALVAELVDFAAACCLHYAASLVAESKSDCPPSIGGECARSTDVLEDRQEVFECLAAAVPHLVAMLLAPEGDPDAPDIPTPRSYAEAITGPYSSPWQTAMDVEMASWKSTGTYVDTVR